jgi:hypothetical protein
MRQCAQTFVLVLGFIVGVLDWISDWAYLLFSDFKSATWKDACLGFILLQPCWYLLLYIVYIASRPNLEETADKIKKVGLAPVYTSLMYFKILGSFSGMHEFFLEKFGVDDKTLKFLSLENCF